MGRKIVCEKCDTIFKEELLGDATICPVCGESLDDGGEETKDWVTWYYYGFKSNNGKTTSLRSEPIDLNEFGHIYFLIKEFKAPPRDPVTGSEEAKKILRTYVPDAFVFPKDPTPSIMCPRCFSTEFQLVPKKFSLLTGFATNAYSRVCNKCGRKF